MKLLTSLLSAALVAGFAQPAVAAASFVNGLAIPGDLLDKSGGTRVNDGRFGSFSDIYYDPGRNEWWGLSDRGPGGGTISYDTRVSRFALDVNRDTGAISNFRVLETVLFSDAGNRFNGLAPSPVSNLGRSMDPEGIVVNTRTGTLLVSDEYGPSLREFSRSGELLRTFNTPANLLPRNATTGALNFANDTGNTAGRRTNRGFEGLALSPDGKYAYAMLQSAMLDEGGGNGTVNRIVKFDTTTGEAVAQYAYEMKRSGQGQGISALVAINDHEFFVLERNNRGVGVGADLATADKEVYRIDLRGATDVSNIRLGSGAPYTKVTKSGPVLDLDANTLAALGNKSPEKWEGLAIGPQLNDGSYLVLAGTDNDYSVTQNGSGTQFDVWFDFSAVDPYASSIQCPLDSRTGCFRSVGGAQADWNDKLQLLPGVLQAYRFSAADLGGYVAPLPEPGSAALALGALGVLAGLRLRRQARPSSQGC